MGRRNAANAQSDNDEGTVETSPLDIDMVSTMDEIQIDDLGDDIPPREFDEMESAFGSDDDDEDEDEDEDEPTVKNKRARRDALEAD